MDNSYIEQNLKIIRKTISAVESKTPLKQILLIGVSKKQNIEKINLAIRSGLFNFGENYVQEALKKQALLKQYPIVWHFIGRLQSKKVKDVVGNFEWIHSVDSWSLAQIINKQAQKIGIKQKILFQVNVGEEVSKTGFSPNEILELLVNIDEFNFLDIRGLMTFPPLCEDENKIRFYFKKSHEIFDDCRSYLDQSKKCKSFEHLSMGTSYDYNIAIQEGATMVRLGSCLFGSRVEL